MESGEGTPQNAREPRAVVAVFSGGLMLRVPAPAGVPQNDVLRSRRLRLLDGPSVLPKLSIEERGALASSLSMTYSRFVYHHGRYSDLRRELDLRRDAMPGEVTYDALVPVVHFELQALCGAARSFVDQLIYIVARRYGASIKDAAHAPWEATPLICGAIPGKCNVPEVRRLRSLRGWYEKLNVFRNTFFHNGWRHGSGHFAPGDERAAAKHPAMNSLILPDFSSIRSRSKPDKWTWKDETQIDEVVGEVTDGLNLLVDGLCESDWKLETVDMGTVPEERYPTVIVSMVIPALVEAQGSVLLPVFSTKEKARECGVFRDEAEVELIAIHASSDVIRQKAFTISLRGLEIRKLLARISGISVVLNPRPCDGDWARVEVDDTVLIDLKSLAEELDGTPVSFTAGSHDILYVYRTPTLLGWVI